LVEDGAAGEVCIAGPQLALGYVADSDHTAARFVPDALVPGERMYRTGDIGRITATGDLEILGRDDGEAHVNGHRIHVAEIEHALERCDGVVRAVVLPDRVAAVMHLDAYVVTRFPLTALELRQQLLVRLPAYMIPGRWHLVDELPLLPGGKVDRQTLSSLAATTMRTVDRPQDVGAIEAVVLDICRAELQTADLTGADHFIDGGGDSLAGMRVALRIEERFGVELLLDDLFTQPTLADLARVVAERSLRGSRASER
jgi:acyl carrier protein